MGRISRSGTQFATITNDEAYPASPGDGETPSRDRQQDLFVCTSSSPQVSPSRLSSACACEVPAQSETHCYGYVRIGRFCAQLIHKWTSTFSWTIGELWFASSKTTKRRMTKTGTHPSNWRARFWITVGLLGSASGPCTRNSGGRSLRPCWSGWKRTVTRWTRRSGF